MTHSFTRRNFVKWGTLTAGAASLAGFAGTTPVAFADEAAATPFETVGNGTGTWLNAPCYNNCSCGSARCLNKVYVEDGVPLKMRGDGDMGDEDTYAVPQRRSCLRGRAKISEVYSPARIKYPMKRKNFTLDDPHGELRGIDEWERLSWDEALDLVAEGISRMEEQYGPTGILCAASSNIGDGYYDQNVCLLDALGGSVHHEAGTVSFGSWSVADTHMLGGLAMANTPHHLQLVTSDLHVIFGFNWASNKAGNHAYYIQESRARGAKVIAIDPWLSQTAQPLADEWIPILPGTDTALVIAICHEWIVNETYDKEFLDTYCVGFDQDTMPEDAPENASWKDYVMGTGYDMVEKTPEWAEAICGVPADKIRELAEEIAATDKVDFNAAQSTSKIPAGEQFVQAFYTMALMHGGIGTPGHYFGWSGVKDYMSSSINAGAYCPTTADPANPLAVAGSPVYMWYPIPVFASMEDPEAWLNLEPSECWRTIKSGEYGRDCWPTGKRKVDIHAIYFGGHMCTLNQIPDAMTGREVVRSMDFVWGVNPFFDPARQYCDVVLPCATFWEKPGKMFGGDAGSALWFDKIIDPLYEARYESEIAEALAERLGLDPKVVNTLTDAERTYATVRDATEMDGTTFEQAPLLTITQEEIDAFFPGVEGAPQEGKYTFEEFRDRGILKAQLTEDMFIPEPYMGFIADPEGAPLNTASGKFEIYCPTLAYMINSVGYSEIAPIGMYQIGDPEQGAGTQTDEFPLLLWTPHSLRRAHSVNDNVVSLREAFPQECFMSVIDAEARGIQNGDTVLMTSPHGKVLRHAKVMPTLVPGAVAIQDGAWMQIDEETGIDLGGCPNVLQAPKSSGGGCQAWTGTLVQVEKYDGPLTLEADKNRPIVVPVGIED